MAHPAGSFIIAFICSLAQILGDIVEVSAVVVCEVDDLSHVLAVAPRLGGGSGRARREEL
jgi:hypothetical protein